MADAPILNLDLTRQGQRSLSAQIHEALRARIVEGRFAAGTRLPPTRKLAVELGVSRATVVTAYDQLIAEGFVHGRIGSGVFVADIGTIEAPSTSRAPQVDDAINSPPPPRSPKPFLPGQPDGRLFPFRPWGKCVARVARIDPGALVHASDPFGDWKLRAEIVRYLADWRGIAAIPEQVLITAGAIDALELCLRTQIRPGDRVALEDPGYPPLRAFVESLGIPTVRVRLDPEGGVPFTPVADGKMPKLVVLTPSSQFPLGGVMPQARRNAFLAWVQQTNGWIIEDDYDSEFRYSGRPVAAMTAMDPAGRTVYVGSFSKIFTGGLRMGFAVVPRGRIQAFAATVRRFGTKASVMPQRPLADFMKQGEFYRHIRRVRRIYAERRAVFLELLRTRLGPSAQFEDHHAGMQVAVRFPDCVPDTELAATAATAGLSCPALSPYFTSPPVENGLLMGFCNCTPEEMRAAMPRLEEIVASRIAGSRLRRPGSRPADTRRIRSNE